MALFRRRPAGRHAGTAARPVPAAVPPWEEAGWTPPAYAQPYLETVPYDESEPVGELPVVPEQAEAPAYEALPEDVSHDIAAVDEEPQGDLPSYVPPPFAFAQRSPAPPPVGERALTGPLPVVPAQEARLRVELGFRDGSVAALAPDSVQARALSAIVDVLVRRD